MTDSSIIGENLRDGYTPNTMNTGNPFGARQTYHERPQVNMFSSQPMSHHERSQVNTFDSQSTPFSLLQRAEPQGLPEFDIGELSLKKANRELIVRANQLTTEQLFALKRRLLDEYRSFIVADANQKIARENKLDTRLTIDAPLDKLQEAVAAVRYLEAQAFWTRRAMDLLYVAAIGAEILSDFMAFPRFNLKGWAERIKGTTTTTRLVPSLGRLFKQTPWLIRFSSSPMTQITVEIMQSMIMYGLQNGSGGAMLSEASREDDISRLADVTLLRATNI